MGSDLNMCLPHVSDTKTRSWQAVRMQHYLALTASELLATTPPDREPVSVDEKDVPEGSSWEETAEDARDDAALQSLTLARESGDVPTRLVASGSLRQADPAFADWAQIDEIYADDTLGQEICTELFLTQSQAEADRLMEDLYEDPLMWYDISERLDLGNALVRPEPIDEI